MLLRYDRGPLEAFERGFDGLVELRDRATEEISGDDPRAMPSNFDERLTAARRQAECRLV